MRQRDGVVVPVILVFDGVIDGDAPRDREAVAVLVGVMVLVIVIVDERVSGAVSEPVAVCDIVALMVKEGVFVPVPVLLTVIVVLGVPVIVPVSLKVAVPVLVPVPESVGSAVP